VQVLKFHASPSLTLDASDVETVSALPGLRELTFMVVTARWRKMRLFSEVLALAEGSRDAVVFDQIKERCPLLALEVQRI